MATKKGWCAIAIASPAGDSLLLSLHIYTCSYNMYQGSKYCVHIRERFPSSGYLKSTFWPPKGDFLITRTCCRCPKKRMCWQEQPKQCQHASCPSLVKRPVTLTVEGLTFVRHASLKISTKTHNENSSKP